jgi:hypothetical protein
MQQQRLEVQHEAPLSLWIAGGIAALAYITALHFATYWTAAGTLAVLAAVSAVRWLRSNR